MIHVVGICAVLLITTTSSILWAESLRTISGSISTLNHVDKHTTTVPVKLRTSPVIETHMTKSLGMTSANKELNFLFEIISQ